MGRIARAVGPLGIRLRPRQAQRGRELRGRGRRPIENRARIEPLIPLTKGYDHNYVLRSGGQRFALAAWCYEPHGGRLMHVYTDQPGMQLYTGKRYFRDGKPIKAAPEQKHNTVCFETQHFPDAVNHPHFPSVILRPGRTFRSATTFRFGCVSGK